MRTLTTRIVPLIAALPRCMSRERVRPGARPAAPRRPPAPPSPFALSGGGNALLGKKVGFRGAVDSKLAGRTVVVQYLEPTTQAWTKQATTTRRSHDGTFVARWKPRHIGQFRTRAIVRGRASAASASPELPLNVVRPAVADLVRPGLLRQARPPAGSS